MTIDDEIRAAQTAAQAGGTPAATPEQAPATPDWSKLTIPEEVIREHPAYKAVLSESIERRQAIASLKQELEQAKQPPAPATPVKPPETPDTPSDPRIDQLAQMVEALTTKWTQSEQARVAQFKAGLIQQHNIPDKLAALITGETVEAIQAQVESVLPYVQPHKSNTSLGNTGDGEVTDGFMAEVDRILNGQGNLDPFSPQLHSAMGGDL